MLYTLNFVRQLTLLHLGSKWFAAAHLQTRIKSSLDLYLKPSANITKHQHRLPLARLSDFQTPQLSIYVKDHGKDQANLTGYPLRHPMGATSKE